jgi:hypothetical protein
MAGLWLQVEAPLHAAPADEGVPQDAKSGMQFHQAGMFWAAETLNDVFSLNFNDL